MMNKDSSVLARAGGASKSTMWSQSNLLRNTGSWNVLIFRDCRLINEVMHRAWADHPMHLQWSWYGQPTVCSHIMPLEHCHCCLPRQIQWSIDICVYVVPRKHVLFHDTRLTPISRHSIRCVVSGNSLMIRFHKDGHSISRWLREVSGMIAVYVGRRV